jgi:hypothetical protein
VSDGLILAACTPAYFPTAMGAKFWALTCFTPSAKNENNKNFSRLPPIMILFATKDKYNYLE